MGAKKKERLFKDQAAWRRWLQTNHAKATELWLIYHKKKSDKKSVTYQEALDEGLCWGWIDSTVNTIDDERYKQRWTPRKPKSIWSERNKKHVARLIKSGQMEAPGLKAIEIAKKNGSWNRLDKVVALEMADDLVRALAKNKKAKAFFEQLAPSQKKQYIYWIESAKREETRAKRIAETVARAAKGIKPGIQPKK